MPLMSHRSDDKTLEMAVPERVSAVAVLSCSTQIGGRALQW